jgi:hypothetical protein
MQAIVRYARDHRFSAWKEKRTYSKHSRHISDLPGQSDHLAQRAVVARLRLGELHVGALQALVQHVHDLGRNIADIGILLIWSVKLNSETSDVHETYGSVNVRHDGAEPLKTQLDVGLEARGDGS